MKKFMKAIAFVTVMCMALSTVAFAAGNAVLDEETEKVLNITVTGAGSDQVALMVVASDATDFSNPLYIDQKAADGSAEGKAEFTAVLTNVAVDAVDVYVGYATYAATNPIAPEKIGEDVAITEPVTTIAIAKATGSEKVVNESGATGVGATFTVTAPEGAKATSMIWAIRYNNNGTPDIKYTAVQNIADYGIGTVIQYGTPINLGVAFPNGSDEIAALNITGVDAIFFFQGVETPVVSNNAQDIWNDGTDVNN